MGFGLSELSYIDIGDIVIIAHEMIRQSEEVPLKEATQEDIDNF